MNTILWMKQAGMEPMAQGQHRAFQQALEQDGWQIGVQHYQPRMPWRSTSQCDWLIWSFVPAQLDVWSARLYAKRQMALVHELETNNLSIPKLDCWCVPSESLRMQLIDCGVEHERISISQGYAPVRSSATRSTSHDGRGPLIYVGGPQTKNTGNSLAVWALAITQYLHPSVRMLLHGKGPMADPVAQFAQSTCEPGSVIIANSDEPVDTVVGSADVVWLPRFQDGVPDALFSALAQGKPILASEQPSFKEWLRHDVNALMLPVDRVPLWAGAMDRLMIEKGLKERLGNAARATAIPGTRMEVPVFLRQAATAHSVVIAA